MFAAPISPKVPDMFTMAPPDPCFTIWRSSYFIDNQTAVRLIAMSSSIPMGPGLDGMLVDPPTATRWEVDEDDPAVVFYTGGTTDPTRRGWYSAIAASWPTPCP